MQARTLHMTDLFDGQANLMGQINFQKPIKTLVSDVAHAIGESVRRM